MSTTTSPLPNPRGQFRFALFAFSVLAWSGVSADWINLSGAETAPNIAEITVFDDRVLVRLEAYVGNLDVFSDLVPDELRTDAGKGRPPEAARMANFASDVLVIEGPDGVPLSAELTLAEPRLRVDRQSPFAGMTNPQTGRPVAEPPADKRVLYAEIEYLFEGEPATLTFSPPLDTTGNPVVSIGFITYHKAVPVIDFRYLSGPETLRLDWDDPWYSRFENAILKRHHKNAMMSFLYVEPREVRHEVLVRVRDLEQWAALGLDDDDLVGLAERTAIKTAAREFFESRNPLRIDGEPRSPASTRAEFLDISVQGVRVLEERKPLDRSTAIVGLILSYPIRHLPQHVSVDWELFNERNERIPSTAIDPAGPLASFVDPESPTIEWRNFLKQYVEPRVVPVRIDTGGLLRIPVLSVALVLCGFVAAGLIIRRTPRVRFVCAVLALVCLVAAIVLVQRTVVQVRNPFAGSPNVSKTAEIVEAVLGNVHTAYLERVDSELSAALEGVVAEESKSEVRAELDRALAIRVAGGGVARVDTVEDLSVTDIDAIEGRYGLRGLVTWTARASAAHWGHVHERKVRFRALMEIAMVDGVWKILGLTVVDSQQLT